MKILHILAHLGGGIGAAYAGLGTCGQEQSILLLEEPLDRASVHKVETVGFRILTGANDAAIVKELCNADIVIFSWYHHPALTKFLYNFPAIPIRSILWSHVSGNYFPHIPANFVTKFGHTLFTTPLSLNLPQIQSLGRVYTENRCHVLYGLTDLSPFTKIQRKKHDHFTIGYVGTLGFCKLHPDFVKFCAAVNVPDVRFLMVGTPSTQQEILFEAKQKGIDGRFQFCGQVSNVSQILSEMDVFGYLLNPQHFGTTENALLEAMASGLPVVSLDQCVERHIIENGVTGTLVHSPEEYGAAVRYLFENPLDAIRLGKQAQDKIIQQYSTANNRQCFIDVCRKSLEDEKKIHIFNDFFCGEPADWFLSCVCADRSCFEENRAHESGLIFRERTKGSPIHYHSYFPKDSRLALWSRQLTQANQQQKLR